MWCRGQPGQPIPRLATVLLAGVQELPGPGWRANGQPEPLQNVGCCRWGGVRARWGGVLALSLVVAMLRGGTGLLRGWTGLQPLAAPWQRAFATRSASHVKHSEKKTKLPVILLQNCELGRKGDEVHVSPGYMRNYLYGRRIAVYSTPENKREHHVQRTVRDRTAFLRPAKMAASLSGTPLVMYRHVEPGE